MSQPPAPARQAPGPLPRADDGGFCSTVTARAGEPLAGTAPARRTWLLVEHPGPWGREPLSDAPWPDPLGPLLQERVTASGVRMLAVRRHDARPQGGPPGHPFVALAVTGPGGWAVSRRLDSPAELLTLPLAELAAGHRPDPSAAWHEAGPLWGVCTQGTRDACCARLGRPLAEALASAQPDHTWEISHSGGHRFAPVLLAWPEGLVYGRVPPQRLAEVIDARRRGHLVPDLLRGQAHLREPEQAADVALREYLGLTALDAVRPVAAPAPRTTPDGDDHRGEGPGERVRTWWEADRQQWRVDVRQVRLPPRPASCGKAPEPASAWICDRPAPA